MRISDLLSRNGSNLVAFGAGRTFRLAQERLPMEFLSVVDNALESQEVPLHPGKKVLHPSTLLEGDNSEKLAVGFSA